MKRTDHTRKMAAPIVVTVLFLAYLAVYAVAVVQSVDSAAVAVLLALPLIALGAGMVVVLRQRIREIRSGEEDDLGNY